MTMMVNSDAREHLHQFLDHYSNLTADDRHNRFFSTMSSSAIRDWLISITSKPNSHFFFVKENEVGQFVGLVTIGINSEKENEVGQFVGLVTIGINSEDEADVAVSILSESRGQGLAQELLNEAIDAAKAMGLKRLVFECLLGNRDCKHLFTKLGFTCNYSFDQQCLIGYLSLEEKND